jgi:hypothetical protein
MAEVPPASLASLVPYPVPMGGRLVFTYERWTTDGWSRGSVRVVFEDGRPARVVARNVPVIGDARTARALGEYARLFPEPLPVAGG